MGSHRVSDCAIILYWLLLLSANCASRSVDNRLELQIEHLPTLVVDLFQCCMVIRHMIHLFFNLGLLGI